MGNRSTAYQPLTPKYSDIRHYHEGLIRTSPEETLLLLLQFYFCGRRDGEGAGLCFTSHTLTFHPAQIFAVTGQDGDGEYSRHFVGMQFSYPTNNVVSA